MTVCEKRQDFDAVDSKHGLPTRWPGGSPDTIHFTKQRPSARRTCMGKFDASQGPVTLRTIESRPLCEVVHAMQGENHVGTLRLDWTRTGVAVATVMGHGHGVYAASIFKRFDMTLGYTGRIIVMGDFREMTAYDPAFRTQSADWFLKHRDKIDVLHVVTQSKLVQMGVTVVNIVLTGLVKLSTNRAEFDAQVRKHGVPVKRLT